MAELKISELSAAVQVLDSDILPMTSGTSTVKVSAEQIKNYVADSLDVSDSAVAGSYVTAVAEANGKVSVTREAADAAPTQNSNKLVKSGGVYSALSGKQDNLTFDNAPTSGSDNPVKSGGVYTALATKQDTLTFDNTPTQNSGNPVKSGGVYAALQNAGHTIKDSTTTFPKRANLVFDGFLVEDDPTNNATIIHKHNVSLVSWSTGTDAEIKAMVDAYYAGELTLADIKSVWSIGDEREVTLSAMAATGVGETHASQTVKFVLMNWGGKTLADDTTCLAIVGQKNSLSEEGYMNSSPNTNTGGWNSSARRTWCNDVYKESIPSDFRSLFKQHKNLSGTGGGSSSGTQQTTDYFALPAEIEVLGSTSGSVAGEGSQFKYYETSANRVKTLGEGRSASGWWERSPYSGNSTCFCSVASNGVAIYSGASMNNGFAPFGCI